MNLGRLSINQPILAMVLSIVLLIVGALAYTTLPVSEYPQVVPPTVVVTTQYPGASAQTVSDTVEARPVTLGPLDEGLRVIREGLKPEDRVIIDGLQRARPGAKVAPHAAPIGSKT